MPAPAELEGVLERARSIGLLGPGPVWQHVEHARRMAAAVERAPATFLDLGCGAGVPGLVLALEWPNARGTLVDSSRKACGFVRTAVGALDLTDRVAVECGRAEHLARDPRLRGTFDLVIARSFAPPAVTAECGVGFLRPGGSLVVSEPPDGSGARWPPAGLAELGFVIEASRPPACRFVLQTAVDERWPRRRPARAPLW